MPGGCGVDNRKCYQEKLQIHMIQPSDCGSSADRRAFIMSSFSVLCLGFTAAFAPDRLFRRNGGVNACIIKIRVVIPPAVVILPCNFSRFQFGGLLLPGTEALLKICGFGAAVKYVGTKADQPIGILNADQFPIRKENSPARSARQK